MPIKTKEKPPKWGLLLNLVPVVGLELSTYFP
jgi:hypothetical protein